MTRFHSPCPALVLAFLLFASPAFAAPFTDNLDGTVTDGATGLIWDQCPWGQSGATCATGSASPHTWAEALAVAVTANAANYKGHDDWRLPNRTELESLVDIEAASNPTIDTTAFPNTPPSQWYWSSTTNADDPAFAWYVAFDGGGAGYYGKNTAGRVRLVRGGQSFGAFDDQAQAQDVAHVPTLTEWTLLMLAGLLALIGFGWMRRPFPRRDA